MPLARSCRAAPPVWRRSYRTSARARSLDSTGKTRRPTARRRAGRSRPPNRPGAAHNRGLWGGPVRGRGASNVVGDAFIACWEAKRFYDRGRPYGWVRIYHKGEMVPGWLGPGKGSGKVKAEEWHPYSPATFVTPPFPGYVSGHA